jgi:hypothetical protein
VVGQQVHQFTKCCCCKLMFLQWPWKDPPFLAMASSVAVLCCNLGALLRPYQPAMQALPPHSRDYTANSRRAWMIGTTQPLDPDDTSPFFDLAPMPPGTEQFAVDTTCFRAPAAPQVGNMGGARQERGWQALGC